MPDELLSNRSIYYSIKSRVGLCMSLQNEKKNRPAQDRQICAGIDHLKFMIQQAHNRPQKDNPVMYRHTWSELLLFNWSEVNETFFTIEKSR